MGIHNIKDTIMPCQACNPLDPIYNSVVPREYKTPIDTICLKRISSIVVTHQSQNHLRKTRYIISIIIKYSTNNQNNYINNK